MSWKIEVGGLFLAGLALSLARRPGFALVGEALFFASPKNKYPKERRPAVWKVIGGYWGQTPISLQCIALHLSGEPKAR